MARKPSDIICESIENALLILMKSNDFQNIKITDIADKAGVGRASFYRYYAKKEDVLRSYLKKITDDFIARMDFDFRRDARKFYIMGLFLHLDKYKELHTMLLKAGLIYLIKDEFDRAFLRHANNQNDRYGSYMAAGAYFNLYYYWVVNGFKESPEELAEIQFSI